LLSLSFHSLSKLESLLDLVNSTSLAWRRVLLRRRKTRLKAVLQTSFSWTPYQSTST